MCLVIYSGIWTALSEIDIDVVNQYSMYSNSKINIDMLIKFHGTISARSWQSQCHGV